MDLPRHPLVLVRASNGALDGHVLGPQEDSLLVPRQRLRAGVQRPGELLSLCSHLLGNF